MGIASSMPAAQPGHRLANVSEQLTFISVPVRAGDVYVGEEVKGWGQAGTAGLDVAFPDGTRPASPPHRLEVERAKGRCHRQGLVGECGHTINLGDVFMATIKI